MSQIRDISCLRRGDVVLFDRGGQTYLKRIHAIAGDIVWAVVPTDDQDGSPWFVPEWDLSQVQDLLAGSPQLGTLTRLRVPDGQMVVFGDAGPTSYDSRFFGSLPIASVRGRVVLPHLFSLWSPDAADCSVALAGGHPASTHP
jgi:signal peptidase I